MKTSTIFLKHVVPIAGGCIALGMFGSPLKAVQRVRKIGLLGDLNPVPFPLIFANCCAWLAYSLVTKDVYLFVPNAAGALLGLYMTTSCLPYCLPKMRDVINLIQLTIAIIVMVVGAATTIPTVALATQKSVWGATCVTVLFFYYFAPLSTLKQVIVSRDSASLYWPLCVMNTINGTLWLVYGMALQDWFIGVPNGVGALLSALCIILCFVFPSRMSSPTAGPKIAAGSSAKVDGSSSAAEAAAEEAECDRVQEEAELGIVLK